MTENVIIRNYRKEDRQKVRDIACDTAFIGEPSGVFFDDWELLADFLTLYYTDYEPESSFVAEAGGEVAGYLIGARDSGSLARIYVSAIAPRLLLKTFLRGTVLRKKNFRFLMSLFHSFLVGELNSPDQSKAYPATFHINMRKDFRGTGIGSKLIGRYLSYLKELGIKGVHVSTLSDKAAGFFESNGFTPLHKTERSYFRHILGRNIRCTILVRLV